jgi:hypothetical protein
MARLARRPAPECRVKRIDARDWSTYMLRDIGLDGAESLDPRECRFC